VNGRFGAVLVILAAGWACSRADYVPDGPLAKPLAQFDRIDVRAIANKVPEKPGEPPSVAPDTFLQGFRKDLTHRLHRRKVLSLSSGPALILEGSLLRYECESRKPTHAKDTMTNKGTIELEIVMTDQAGTRIGRGKASIEYLGNTQDGAMSGAETRILRAIAAYLRKSATGSGPDPDDP